MFTAALVAEAIVVLIYKLDIVSFLWLNAIGALAVIVIAWLLQTLLFANSKSQVAGE